MRVILSPEQTDINSHKHIPDIKMFNSEVLDSECTDLICENFISTFYFDEIQSVIRLIVSKMRINSLLTIQEIDNRILSRRSYIEELELEQINKLLFTTRRKSILTSDKIASCIGDNMKLENIHYDDTSCLAVMKYRRVS